MLARGWHSTLCPFVLVVADTLKAFGLAANVPSWKSHDCGDFKTTRIERYQINYEVLTSQVEGHGLGDCDRQGDEAQRRGGLMILTKDSNV